MNIGIFTDSFTPEINGVVTSLQLLIADFRRRGHDVYIFAPNNSFSTRYSPETNTSRYPSILVLGQQVRLALPFIRTRDIAALNLDIIHVHTPGFIGMTGVRFGKKLKIPSVYTYHTRVERYARYYIHLPAWLEKGTLAFVAKRFYDKHDAIIAPSEGIKKELEKIVSKPITVIPTGVDIEANRKMAAASNAREIFEKYRLKPTDDLLITASRVGKEKNIRFIVDAFPKIRAVCPNAKLLIAGDGPDRKSLEKHAREIAGQDIIFLDFLKQEQLFSLCRLSKIFLFASFTETQGMVILEAMAMGLPVVALAAPGVEDLMAGEAGGFMVKDDPDDFVKKTVALLKDKALWENKSQGSARRAKDFSVDKMTERVIEIYRQVSKKPI